MLHPMPMLPDGRLPKGTSGYRTVSRPDHFGIDFLYPWKPGEPTGSPFTEGKWTCPRGVPALAIADGVVTSLRRRDPGGDDILRIDHGNGFWADYIHLRPATVRKGERVLKGQPVGEVGENGKVIHLHFGLLKNGRYIDPKPYIAGALIVPSPWGAPNGADWKTPAIAMISGMLAVGAVALYLRGRRR